MEKRSNDQNLTEMRRNKKKIEESDDEEKNKILTSKDVDQFLHPMLRNFGYENNVEYQQKMLANGDWQG